MPSTSSLLARKCGCAGLSLLLAGASLLSHAAAGSDEWVLPNDGPTLAAQLRSSPPPEDLEVIGLIRVRRSDGQRSAQPFQYRIITGNESWHQIFETRAMGSLPGQTLTIVHRPDAPPVYKLQGAAAESGHTAEPLVLQGEEAMLPFANSDFWLADLGLEFLHWPEQRIDSNTRLTMRKGRSCRVLESINPRPSAGGYSRVRSWVDLKTGGIIIAEAYGTDQRLLKEFEIGGFTKVNQHWVLKNMEIRNLRTDTRTILEFHYEIN